MKLQLIVCIMCYCHLINAQVRDESGLLNMYEISSLENSVCEKELKIHTLLNNPFFKSILQRILTLPLPFIPGPDKFTPLSVIQNLRDQLAALEDRLSSYLEGVKPYTTERPYTAHSNHTHFEVGDLLATADFVCKTGHLWYDIVITKLSDLIGLWHIRFPIPDFHHRIHFLQALDFLDLAGIPDRFHRLVTGHLGLSTTTTTRKPGFLSSLFGGKTTTTTTTTTTKKPGFLSGLFGHKKTTTTTTTTTQATTKKASGGFLGGLFGSKISPTTVVNSEKESDNKTTTSKLERTTKSFMQNELNDHVVKRSSLKNAVTRLTSSSTVKSTPLTSKKNKNGWIFGHKRTTMAEKIHFGDTRTIAHSKSSSPMFSFTTSSNVKKDKNTESPVTFNGFSMPTFLDINYPHKSSITTLYAHSSTKNIMTTAKPQGMFGMLFGRKPASPSTTSLKPTTEITTKTTTKSKDQNKTKMTSQTNGKQSPKPLWQTDETTSKMTDITLNLSTSTKISSVKNEITKTTQESKEKSTHPYSSTKTTSPSTESLDFFNRNHLKNVYK